MKIEQDIKVLSKVLNSKLFLERFPIINRVAVGKYGRGIEVVIIPYDVNEYWKVKDRVEDFIFRLTESSGIEYDYYIYP